MSWPGERSRDDQSGYSALQTGSLADPLEELAGQFGEALSGRLSPDRLAALRKTLLASASGGHKPGQGRMLESPGACRDADRSLGMPGDGSRKPADEVGFFCAKALSQLARSERQGDGGNDGIVDWVLEHSSSTWGEYLNLLESEESNDPDRDDEIDRPVRSLEELDPGTGPTLMARCRSMRRL